MAGNIKLNGAQHSVELQGNDLLAADSVLTFPATGGELRGLNRTLVAPNSTEWTLSVDDAGNLKVSDGTQGFLYSDFQRNLSDSTSYYIRDRVAAFDGNEFTYAWTTDTSNFIAFKRRMLKWQNSNNNPPMETGVQWNRRQYLFKWTNTVEIKMNPGVTATLFVEEDDVEDNGIYYFDVTADDSGIAVWNFDDYGFSQDYMWVTEIRAYEGDGRDYPRLYWVKSENHMLIDSTHYNALAPIDVVGLNSSSVDDPHHAYDGSESRYAQGERVYNEETDSYNWKPIQLRATFTNQPFAIFNHQIKVSCSPNREVRLQFLPNTWVTGKSDNNGFYTYTGSGSLKKVRIYPDPEFADYGTSSVEAEARLYYITIDDKYLVDTSQDFPG